MSASGKSTSGPSFWIQSSWRGDQTLEQIGASTRKPLTSNDVIGSVGVYAVYGSWNAVPKADHSGLLRLLDTLLHPHARRDTQYATGRIEVDSCDDELELCCEASGDSTTSSTSLKLPCPPGQLPVLLVILLRKTMKEPEIRYISALSSDEILRFWKRHKSTNSVASNAPKQEMGHILQSFGLSAPKIPTPPLLLAASPTTSSNSVSNPSPALRIFIAGDRMSVGKTSVCLGLLGSLIRRGYPPESLAYIKPATQNEQPQLVQRYCERLGIPCEPIGPIVYYRGFTRAFLAGETASSEQLLSQAEKAVDKLAEGKRVVIVDGVGFPAVGSICGTDNASVARASGYPTVVEGQVHQRRPIGVVLVGGSGVGGAVDAFNLNATYMEHANVPVLGAIFNKLSLDGFYSLENCKSQITAYFAQNDDQQHLGRQAFGFVPQFPGIAGDKAMDNVFEFIKVFDEHVDMEAILEAATNVLDQSFPVEMDIDEGDSTPARPTLSVSSSTATRPKKRYKLAGKRGRSRDEIEGDAVQAGAAPSA